MKVKNKKNLNKINFSKKILIIFLFLILIISIIFLFFSIVKLTGYAVFPNAPIGPGDPNFNTNVIINLITPVNNSETNNNTIDFKFNISSDYYDITRCELIINNQTNATILNPVRNSISTIRVVLSNGLFKWKIRCYYSNTFIDSELRTLRINLNIVPSCQDECSPTGSKTCNNNLGYKTCGNTDTDSCLEWSSAVTCPTGKTCSNGECVTITPSCNDECSPTGSKTCNNNLGYKTCGNTDTDLCLEWGNVVNCETGKTCSNGNCVVIVPDCVDECNINNSRICTNNLSYKICGYYDNDSCLEYGQINNCASNESCLNGSCLLNLVDNSNKNNNGFKIISSTGKFSLSDSNNKIYVDYLTNNVPSNIDSSNFIINTGKLDNRNFIITSQNGEKIYDKKTIYLDVNIGSKGVCIKDELLFEPTSLKNKCNYIPCPGSKGEYICSKVSETKYSISGLVHSGIIEISTDSCGDQICMDSENCSICPTDCGFCPSNTNSNNGGGVSPRNNEEIIYKNINSNESWNNSKNNIESTKNTSIVSSSQSNINQKKDVKENPIDIKEKNNGKMYFWIFIVILLIIIISVIIYILIRMFRKKSLLDLTKKDIVKKSNPLDTE
ncbi:MAG: hypothetical protein WC867_04030 [Candidatus Pacearchaeota archaeon]|jgi:hypothetical protein